MAVCLPDTAHRLLAQAVSGFVCIVKEKALCVVVCVNVGVQCLWPNLSGEHNCGKFS